MFVYFGVLGANGWFAAVLPCCRAFYFIIFWRRCISFILLHIRKEDALLIHLDWK